MKVPTITARDMVEERAELVHWLEDRSPIGGAAAWASGHGPQEGKMERTSARRWAPSLRSAELTYVNTDLTRTALAAGDAFEDYSLDITDLPSPHGFIAWEEPITETLDLDYLSGMGITAATWASHGGLVEIRWWSDKNTWIKDFSKASAKSGSLSPGDVQQLRKMHPTRLVAIGHSALNFTQADCWPSARIQPPQGASLVEMSEYGLGEKRLIEAEKTLMASWLLMGQTLTVETSVQAPRAALARIGRIDPSLLTAVRQVTLRHKYLAPDQRGKADGPKREYAYRWCVKGHWRKRPKNARPETPSKIWVTPHFKGPDGAPILDPSKLVNILRR